jgi:membrane protein YqaA with SNARE-associated domain
MIEPIPLAPAPARRPGLFGSLYNQLLTWAAHRHASRWLAVVSFAESSFFPIPPDTMLIPMTLARPERAIRYALIATVASVIGGMFGYVIGHYGADLVQPLIARLGWQHKFETVLSWFATWGFWAVLVAGFTPIPYKLFTIGAGVLGLGILPFTAASIIGRGARFFLECILVARAGPKVAPLIERNMERLGWFIVAVLVCILAWVYLLPVLFH